MTDLLVTGPADPEALLLFAHGAGAGMRTDWMNAFADGLGERGIGVARFEFGYMAARADGKKKPAPKAETLMGEYVAAIESVAPSGRLFIGGKSMGGRVASLVADDAFLAGRIAGLVCMGYPFHPPGSPDKLRTAHLADLKVPTLICQGTRDIFGTEEEIAGYALSPSIEIAFLPDGDHDLRPRKAVSGLGFKDNLKTALDRVAAFIGR